MRRDYRHSRHDGASRSAAGRCAEAPRISRLRFRWRRDAGRRRLTRRRAEGKLANLETGSRASRSPAPSASATPAGRRTARRPRATPIRMPPAKSRSSTTASSRTSAELREELLSQGAQVRERDRHRSRRPSGHRADGERPLAGRRGEGGAAATARRVRAGHPFAGMTIC